MTSVNFIDVDIYRWIFKKGCLQLSMISVSLETTSNLQMLFADISM